MKYNIKNLDYLFIAFSSLLISVFVALFFVQVNHVFAVDGINENFDTYNLGDLNGQGQWTDVNTTNEVVNDRYYSSPYGMKHTNSGVATYTNTGDTDISRLLILRFNIDTQAYTIDNSSIGFVRLNLDLPDDPYQVRYLDFCSNGTVGHFKVMSHIDPACNYGTPALVEADLLLDTWYVAYIKIESNGMIKASIGTGEWSNYVGEFGHTLDHINSYEFGTSGDGIVYFDNIISSISASEDYINITYPAYNHNIGLSDNYISGSFTSMAVSEWDRIVINVVSDSNASNTYEYIQTFDNSIDQIDQIYKQYLTIPFGAYHATVKLRKLLTYAPYYEDYYVSASTDFYYSSVSLPGGSVVNVVHDDFVCDNYDFSFFGANVDILSKLCSVLIPGPDYLSSRLSGTIDNFHSNFPIIADFQSIINDWSITIVNGTDNPPANFISGSDFHGATFNIDMFGWLDDEGVLTTIKGYITIMLVIILILYLFKTIPNIFIDRTMVNDIDTHSLTQPIGNVRKTVNYKKYN